MNLLMAALEPWQKTLVVQSLGFLILVVVLAKLAIPALGKILRERSKGIETQFEKLERDTAGARARLEQYKLKVSQMGEESKLRLKNALEDASQTRDRVMAEAAAGAQAAMDKARREIQIERDKALHELREQAVQIITDAAEHLVKSSMTDEIQNKLVDGYIERMKTVERL